MSKTEPLLLKAEFFYRPHKSSNQQCPSTKVASVSTIMLHKTIFVDLS